MIKNIIFGFLFLFTLNSCSPIQKTLNKETQICEIILNKTQKFLKPFGIDSTKDIQIYVDSVEYDSDFIWVNAKLNYLVVHMDKINWETNENYFEKTAENFEKFNKGKIAYGVSQVHSKYENYLDDYFAYNWIEIENIKSFEINGEWYVFIRDNSISELPKIKSGEFLILGISSDNYWSAETFSLSYCKF